MEKELKTMQEVIDWINRYKIRLDQLGHDYYTINADALLKLINDFPNIKN